MATKKKKEEKSQTELTEIFKSLIKKTIYQNLTSDIFSVPKDPNSNYNPEEFKTLEECIGGIEYSYHCYCLYAHAHYSSKPYYTIRVSDICMVDNKCFYFIAPAYRTDFDMAKVKKVIIPNRLNLTPGKLSIDIDDLPKLKLDHTNSYYDPKLKKRVPLLELKENEQKSEKPKKEKTEKQEVKTTKVDDRMINNTDEKTEWSLHSSDFLPPEICTRLWVLSRGTKVGWSWWLRPVDGYKNKSEFYCRPEELTEEWQMQYNRGGAFVTNAYERKHFPQLDIPELSHEELKKIEVEFGRDAMMVVIDAAL